MKRALAPGSVLLQMYLKRRLRFLAIPDGNAYEIGAGDGTLSHLLLRRGMKVWAYDLNPTACDKNRSLNQIYTNSGHLKISCQDFLQSSPTEPADLILSSMVVEHLPPDTVLDYFLKAKSLLTPTGAICTFVPGSPQHWGIEDEIAGHFKRYTFECFSQIAQKTNLVIRNIAGLTFPVSNFLLGTSNYLVRRSEAGKLQLSIQERTIASGDRNVPLKTTFPSWLRWVINEVTLYPFHLLQCCARNHPSSLIIYCEMIPPQSDSPKH